MEVTLKTSIGGHTHIASVCQPHFIIGRGNDCDLRLDSPMVSRHHCVLVVRDGHVSVRDLESSNKTGVNNQHVEHERSLRDGDTLWVAATPIEVRIRRESRVAERVVQLAGRFLQPSHGPTTASSG